MISIEWQLFAVLLLANVFMLFLIKYKLYRTQKWDISNTCLVGKTAIVTGANTGVGYWVAKELAKRGARVILACRNLDLAQKARKNIVNDTTNNNVTVKQINFASLETIRLFVKDFGKTEKRLDILINNIEADFLSKQCTTDGLQITMQTNYFGPFLLTYLLLGHLKKSAPSRIVHVTSSKAFTLEDQLIIEDLNIWPVVKPEETLYAKSKLCTVIFSNELARKLEGTSVVSNCVCFENLQDSYFVCKNFPFVWFKKQKTAEECARSVVYVAIAKNLYENTGRFFENCSEKALSSDICYSRDVGKKLWNETECLVKLKPDELPIWS